MTAEEYVAYKKAVQDFFEQEGVVNLSLTNRKDEGFFSWKPCECCHRPLAGLRHRVSGYNPNTKEILEYDVCWDCLYYVTYGQLDDTTMMEIEED